MSNFLSSKKDVDKNNNKKSITHFTEKSNSSSLNKEKGKNVIESLKKATQGTIKRNKLNR